MTAKEYSPDKEMMANLSIVEPFSAYRSDADKLWSEFGTTARYRTGWEKFDDFLGGGFGSENRGELVVIAADTGVGKSTFLANIAINVTRLAGEKLHFMSLENPPEDVYNSMRFITGREDIKDMEKYFTGASKKLLFGGRAWQAEDLLAHMEYVVEAHGTKLFVLDHLNFMFENEEQLQNEHLRTRVIMRKLSRFAMNHKVCIFVVSHINKPAAGSASKKLGMERIYGSGAIAGAATKVLVLQERIVESTRFIDVFYLKSRFTRNDKTNKAVFNVDTPQWVFDGIWSAT